MKQQMQKSKKLLNLGLSFALLTGFVLPESFAQKASAAAASHVVISQVYGAGGNNGATYKNDFIELYNPTNSDVNLNGWTVQYASSAGNTWNATPLTGKTIKAHSFLLVQEGGGASGVDLPTPDVTASIAMAAGAGKVVLTNSSALLTVKDPTSVASVVDFVGYGAAADPTEGNTKMGDLTTTKSAQRKSEDGTPSAVGKGAGWDTDSNGADFVVDVIITPRNSMTPAVESPAESIEVTGVALDKAALTFTTGGAAQTLAATVQPQNATNKNVTWSSNNPAVATVVNGVVTPVATGTAEITVTTEDGSKTASATVTVSSPVTGPLTIIAGNSNWKYHDKGQDLGTAWRSEGYDDTTWTSGQGAFGFKDDGSKISSTLFGANNTTISYGGDKNNKYPTVYFRKIVNVDSIESYAQFVANFAIDDGLVIYVNGTEIKRYNMPAGEIQYGTWAGPDAPGNPVNYQDVNLTQEMKANLHNGENVIEVELHNQRASSSDIYFDMSLTALPLVLVTDVALNPASLTLAAGGATQTLTATVNPTSATNKNVTWSSSNPAVATVANGVVTPVAAGTAIITVTTADGNKTATSTVTVNAANVSVTGVTLDKTTLTMTAGGATQTLAATVNPTNATNKNVTWSSSNPAVATVANGVVTPVAAGTAIITVTTADGNKTATSTVTVNAANVSVTGVTLDKTTLTMTAGGATQTLAATVNPTNATNKNVTWSSSNPAVATVANGVVTPVAAGTAVITVTTADGGKTTTSTVVVQERDAKASVKIYTKQNTVISGSSNELEFYLGLGNANDVNGIDATFRYDNTKFKLKKLEALNQSESVVEFVDNAGEVRVLAGLLTPVTSSDYTDVLKMTLEPIDPQAKKVLADVRLINVVTASKDVNIEDPTNNFGDTALAIIVRSFKDLTDINGDDKLDIADLSLAIEYYRADSKDANWNLAQRADVNLDGIVDLTDFTLIMIHLMDEQI